MYRFKIEMVPVPVGIPILQNTSYIYTYTGADADPDGAAIRPYRKAAQNQLIFLMGPSREVFDLSFFHQTVS